jgi:hypothetical protein
MRRALCSIDEEAPARVAFCLGGQLRATQPSRAETMLLEVHTLLMQAAARDENGQAVKNLRAIYLAVFGVRRLGDLLVGLLGSASALMLRILLPSLSAFCCSHGCVHGEVLPHWVRCVPARGGPDPEDWGAWAMARQAARVVYAELPVSIVCLAAHWPIVDAPWRLVSDAVVCLPCAPRAASRMHRLHPDVVAAERGLFQRALNEAVFSQHPVPACALRWLVFFYASFRMVNSAWREVLFGSWAPGTAEAFVSALHALHLASEDARSLPLVQSCRLPTRDVAWARSVVPPVWFPVHNHGCGGSPRQFSCWVEGARLCWLPPRRMAPRFCWCTHWSAPTVPAASPTRGRTSKSARDGRPCMQPFRHFGRRSARVWSCDSREGFMPCSHPLRRRPRVVRCILCPHC